MNNGQTYELGYLALPTLSAEEAQALQTTLGEQIASFGGQVVSQGDVHFIDLAYEMIKKVGSRNDRYDQGYFTWIKFVMDPSAVASVKENCDGQSNLLRYMIVKTVGDDELTNVFTLEQTAEEAAEEVKEAGSDDSDDESTDVDEKNGVISADDLTVIEGIGPAIRQVLSDAGYGTFDDLAAATVDQITEILAAEGLSQHNPATWAQQAALARDGKMEELKKWQEELQGGRE